MKDKGEYSATKYKNCIAMKCVHQNTSLKLVLGKCFHPLFSFSLVQPVTPGGDIGGDIGSGVLGHLIDGAQGAGYIDPPEGLINLMAEAPAFQKNVDREKTHTDTHFSKCSSIILFKKRRCPPTNIQRPQLLMPLHKFVRLLREAAKLMDLRQVLDRPCPMWCLRQGDFDESHLGRRCFFLAEYDDLLTEVWDQPLLCPVPCHPLQRMKPTNLLLGFHMNFLKQGPKAKNEAAIAAPFHAKRFGWGLGETLQQCGSLNFLPICKHCSV